MIAIISKVLCGFLLVLTLAACASHMPPTGNLAEDSRADFMNAMRWKRFQVAASLMEPQLRQDFLATFAPLRDIHIVDVRLMEVQPFDGERRFEAIVEMDYYLLPSVTVKTFSFAQSWEYFSGDDPERQGFLIVTPFPDFP